MDSFIDREEEMQILEQQYAGQRSAFVVLYGRRRVGKTALINAFCREKHALYWLATQENIVSNRQSFGAAVAEFTQNPILKSGGSFSWEVLFGELGRFSEQGRIVIVLDEFQYLGRSYAAFPSVLQKIWDLDLCHRNVMLILCGSQVSLMEKQALSAASPLYGRRTGQLRLLPIPFRHYADFFVSDDKEFSQRQLVEYYAVTGGVPRYVELFRPCSDIYDAIYHNVLKQGTYLYEEPMFLLQDEVQSVGTYFSILKTIAAGNRKLGRIAGCMEVRPTDLTHPLRTLMDLDILEREVPVTEENPERSKKGLYRIKDNFLQFWFRFVYPYRSRLESGYSEEVLNHIRNSMTVNHTSYVYEDICRKSVWTLCASGVLPASCTRVGRWWNGRDGEVDVVALDGIGKQDIVFGECKFIKDPMGADVLAGLREKAGKIPWGGRERREHFVLFSMGGFSPALREIAENREDVTLVDGF